MKKFFKKALYVFILVVLLLFGSGYLYTSDYYRADHWAVCSAENTESVTVSKDNEVIIFMPEEIKAGMIFYPGGKVEYTAYAPLGKMLAEQGVLCIIPHMPFNLAVFDIFAADAITEKYIQVNEWYIGGHSLGGSMAAECIAKSSDLYKGLILLASYSVSDISEKNVDVLSVSATNDNIINMDKYNEYKANLPENTSEIVIEGGCHAYFGSYGNQKGDGKPTISVYQQIQNTAGHITEFILK